MTATHRLWSGLLVGGLLVAALPPRAGLAYSALTHEAIVDTVWDDSIKPLLKRKYAGVTDAELHTARAYVYGGCIVQDMGYYPFGNALFTNLMHYVRSGDFAVALLDEAEPIDEYAFALGALEHYVADPTGHATATNLVVPIEFPKLRRRYDSWVTYEDDPGAHLKIEFAFDVLQVARGRYTPAADHDFIGFAVAKHLLDRTFYRVYGFRVDALLADEDLAIGTYRRTVSTIIPEATKVAWEMKKDELRQLMPGIQRQEFVYGLSSQAYEKEWGNEYERPRWYDKVLALVFRLVPKFGPLRALSIKPLTPGTERLFAASFAESVDKYRNVLAQLPGPVQLANVNLDTGEAARAGTYRLADQAYAELVERLARYNFADATPELRDDILAYYGDLSAPIATKRHFGRWRHLVAELAELRALQAHTSLAQHRPAR